MAITVKCEECGRTLKVREEMAGTKVACPGCGAVLQTAGNAGGHGGGRTALLNQRRLYLLLAWVLLMTLTAAFLPWRREGVGPLFYGFSLRVYTNYCMPGSVAVDLTALGAQVAVLTVACAALFVLMGDRRDEGGGRGKRKRVFVAGAVLGATLMAGLVLAVLYHPFFRPARARFPLTTQALESLATVESALAGGVSQPEFEPLLADAMDAVALLRDNVETKHPESVYVYVGLSEARADYEFLDILWLVELATAAESAQRGEEADGGRIRKMNAIGQLYLGSHFWSVVQHRFDFPVSTRAAGEADLWVADEVKSLVIESASDHLDEARARYDRL